MQVFTDALVLPVLRKDVLLFPDKFGCRYGCGWDIWKVRLFLCVLLFLVSRTAYVGTFIVHLFLLTFQFRQLRTDTYNL